MTSYRKLNWEIRNDAEQVAEAAVVRILAAARDAIDDHGCFRLVLAGGGTPKRAYQMLAQQPVDWSGWRFYYGDERCLPADDPERNSVMACQAWLDPVGIEPWQHFPMAAEQGAEAAAQHYLETIAEVDTFDLILLGMGEDGHTASLFPNRPWQPDARVIAVHDAPKPPPDRVSLGPAVIHQATRRCFLVTGAAKADAVAGWRQDADLPIRHAALEGDTVIIDESAWGSAPNGD